MVPMFDIFSGCFPQKDAKWIESAEGLPAAYQQMLRMAADKPGPYFVLSNYTRKCVASIDTADLFQNFTDECA